MKVHLCVHANRDGIIEFSSIRITGSTGSVVLLPNMGLSIRDLLMLGKMENVEVQDTANSPAF